MSGLQKSESDNGGEPSDTENRKRMPESVPDRAYRMIRMKGY